MAVLAEQLFLGKTIKMAPIFKQQGYSTGCSGSGDRKGKECKNI